MATIEANISMSVDGYITGPNINEHPGLGEGGEILHAWLTEDDGQKILQEDLFRTAGAVVTSRKVYEDAKGWGADGFYQMPVFVITHRPHETITKGKTTFTFVTEGIQHAIAQAAVAAGDKKVHVMGGASIIRQALKAGLIDELRLHVAPVILGAGTPLFDDLNGPIHLERIQTVESRFATHLRFRVVK